MISVSDGQLPTSAGALYTRPTTSPLGPSGSVTQVMLSCLNTSGSTTETIVVTLTRAASGTARRIAHAVLGPNEQLFVSGIPMGPGDVLSGQTTDGTTVDYVVSTMSPLTEVPLQVYALDTNGNLKQNQASAGGLTVGGSLTVGGQYVSTSYATPAAAGSTQGTATALSAANNLVSVPAASDGVILPSTAVLGQEVSIMNASASNAMKVYPDGTGTINGGSASAAKTLAAATGATYLCISAGPNAQWYSLSN